MEVQQEVLALLDRAAGLAPSGYAIALHVRFTTPTFLFQSYPRDWITLYSQRGYLMSDPTVLWAFGNTGRVRWSELAASDSAGMFAEAAGFGMGFGLSLSTGLDSSQSLASFTRPDRDYDDDEIGEIEALFHDLHRTTAGLKGLDPETHTALTRMSIIYTHPNG